MYKKPNCCNALKMVIVFLFLFRNCSMQYNICCYIHSVVTVDEPCQFGCSSLKFCSNFNNQSGNLSRQCNAHADRAAQREFYLWKKQRVVKLPFMDVPILDLGMCQPETWKALACISHVKPCHPNTHSNGICR